MQGQSLQSCGLGFTTLQEINLQNCEYKHSVPGSVVNFSCKICLKSNRYRRLVLLLSGQVMLLSSLLMNVSIWFHNLLRMAEVSFF